MYIIEIKSKEEREIILEALKNYATYKKACAGSSDNELSKLSETALKMRNRIMKATR